MGLVAYSSYNPVMMKHWSSHTAPDSSRRGAWFPKVWAVADLGGGGSEPPSALELKKIKKKKIAGWFLQYKLFIFFFAKNAICSCTQTQTPLHKSLDPPLVSMAVPVHFCFLLPWRSRPELAYFWWWLADLKCDLKCAVIPSRVIQGQHQF